jgi:hypothetical protein
MKAKLKQSAAQIQTTENFTRGMGKKQGNATRQSKRFWWSWRHSGMKNRWQLFDVNTAWLFLANSC